MGSKIMINIFYLLNLNTNNFLVFNKYYLKTINFNIDSL